MVFKKIRELDASTQLPGGSLSKNDLLAAADVNGNKTVKVTPQEIIQSCLDPDGGLEFGDNGLRLSTYLLDLLVRDTDLDGIADYQDSDIDGDNYLNDEDADPNNPYVFTGDEDRDGVDATIDPDDNDANVGIFTANSYPKLYYNYDYTRNNVQSSYSSYYNRNTIVNIPPEAQGCLMARPTMTTSSNSGYADNFHYLTPRSTANPSTFTDQGGRTGDRDDYDPYPITTGIPVETFFRVNVPKGDSHWNTLYNFEFNITPTPYFLNDGTIFSIPFEWNGFYPLYTTEDEAKARSTSNSAHSFTFTWSTGPSNQISGLDYPYWAKIPSSTTSQYNTIYNVTRVFWMPDGLTAATSSTPARQYLTHFWHGNHPGLPIWSQVSPAGSEQQPEGNPNGYMAKNNGTAYEWMGPQSGNNLAINSDTYNGVYDNLIYPPAVQSPSLNAIKKAIQVTRTP